MKLFLLSRPNTCCHKILKMRAPASHRCIGVQKRGRGQLDRDSLCSPLFLKSLVNAILALQSMEEGPASLDHQKMQTNGSSTATKGGTSRLNLWERIIPGMPCGLGVVVTSLQVTTNHYRDAMWPWSCCNIFAGSDKRRNLSARSRNLTIRESVGKTLPWIVSISIPRYKAALESSRSNFSQLMTIPRS